MPNEGIKQDLISAKHVHFIGIGGISMSALALILNAKGYHITGSDTNWDNCTALINADITVYGKQSAENIISPDLVIYTAAIKQDNPELIAAREKGIACYERADLLGAIMAYYDCPIGVAGTHGKSTTTSMLSCIFLESGLNPTISIGANLPEIDSNYHIGDKDYFIFESCEYAGSFLKFYPKISIILNIDEDHLDFYHNIDDITDAFDHYILNTSADGLLITNAEDVHCEKIKNHFHGKKITFGLKQGDYSAQDIVYRNGYPSFNAMYNGKKLCTIELNIPGEHNVLNALAATACAHQSGISLNAVVSGLNKFRGAQRRFEFKGKSDGFTVIDDYAHHPSEIEATIKAARKMNFDKIILIFQPHTFSRTKALLPQFLEALSLADKVVLCDIYAAREKENLGISSELVASMIDNAVYASSFKVAAEISRNYALTNSLILTMGAGDVFKTADYLLK